MDNSALRSDASLVELLVARARDASDGRLVLDVVGGLALALVFVMWRPSVWLVPFAVGICLLAFGTWGIADRELGERTDAPPGGAITALRVARVTAAVAGAVAAALAVLAALGAALGTWIS